jgi:hypothetical protein
MAFSIKFTRETLAEYAAERNAGARNFNDLSPLEEWLISKLCEETTTLQFKLKSYAEAWGEYDKQGTKLIREIEASIAKLAGSPVPPSPFRHSIWFSPKRGVYIYHEREIRAQIITPLIQGNRIAFRSIEHHQEELMLRYVVVK